MKNRSLLALALLAMSTMPCAAGSGGFDGFYLGSGVGGGLGHVTTSTAGQRGSLGNGLSGISGDLFAGYGGTYFGNVYTGVEGSFDLSSFHWSDGGGYGPLTKVERPYGLGAVGRLGYEFSPQFMVYGIGGLAYNHFDAYRFGGAEQGKWDAGLRFGGGGEFNFGMGIFARLSYEGDLNEVYYDALATSARSIIHTGKLGVGYRF